MFSIEPLQVVDHFLRWLHVLIMQETPDQTGAILLSSEVASRFIVVFIGIVLATSSDSEEFIHTQRLGQRLVLQTMQLFSQFFSSVDHVVHVHLRPVKLSACPLHRWKV